MSTDNSKKDDTRPSYVPPQVIRLDDVNKGIGNCGAGSSPGQGDCSPSGNGATTGAVGCETGNGAKPYCLRGNGIG